jgi:hypothetical protein
MYTRLDLNCLNLSCARITGVLYHTQQQSHVVLAFAAIEVPASGGQPDIWL